MDIRRIAAGLPGLLALAGALLAGPAIAAAAWSHYSNPALAVSIDFPGPPRATTTTEKAGATSYTLTIVEHVVGDGTDFALVVSEYQLAGAPDPTTLLEGAARGEMNSVNGVVVWKNSITVEGNPGLDLVGKAQGPKGEFLVRSRLVWRGNRLYQAITSSNNPDATAPGTDRFLASLKLSAAPEGH